MITFHKNKKTISSDVLRVLKEKKITEYLRKKGHEPIKKNNGRLFFLCPFPDHNETKPSFTVWIDKEFENFYCFGCNRSNTIVNLVSELEAISYKEAFRRLSDGIEIDIEDDIKTEIANIEKVSEVDPFLNLAKSLIDIASVSRSFIEGSNFSDEEISIIDKMHAEVDKNIIELNFDKIDEIALSLPSILFKRREKILNNERIRS